MVQTPTIAGRCSYHLSWLWRLVHNAPFIHTLKQNSSLISHTFHTLSVLLGGQRNPEGNTCWYCKWECGWLGAALPGLGWKQGPYRAERFPEPQGLGWFTGADLIPMVTLPFFFLILCWGLYRIRWDNLNKSARVVVDKNVHFILWCLPSAQFWNEIPAFLLFLYL